MRCAWLPAVRRAGAPAAPRGADSARGVPESACGRSAAWPSLGWPAYRSVGQSSGSTSLRKRREVVGTGPDRVAGICGSDQAPVAARSAEQRRGAPRPVVVARRAVRRYARQARQAVVPCRIRSAAVCSGYRAGRPAAVRATKLVQRRGHLAAGVSAAQPSIGLGVTPARRCSAGARGHAEHGIAPRLLANLVDCLSWAAARPPTLSRTAAKWLREDVRAGDGLADPVARGAPTQARCASPAVEPEG